MDQPRSTGQIFREEPVSLEHALSKYSGMRPFLLTTKGTSEAYHPRFLSETCKEPPTKKELIQHIDNLGTANMCIFYYVQSISTGDVFLRAYYISGKQNIACQEYEAGTTSSAKEISVYVNKSYRITYNEKRRNILKMRVGLANSGEAEKYTDKIITSRIANRMYTPIPSYMGITQDAWGDFVRKDTLHYSQEPVRRFVDGVDSIVTSMVDLRTFEHIMNKRFDVCAGGDWNYVKDSMLRYYDSSLRVFVESAYVTTNIVKLYLMLNMGVINNVDPHIETQDIYTRFNPSDGGNSGDPDVFLERKNKIYMDAQLNSDDFDIKRYKGYLYDYINSINTVH